MVKKLIFTMLLVALFICAKSYADNPADYYSESTYEVYLYEIHEDEVPEHPIQEPIKERRTPSKRLAATISLDYTIEIPGINVSEIYSFEIYDEEGNCLSVFNSPEDFVQAIFLHNESIKIRLVTAEYALVGYL